MSIRCIMIDDDPDDHEIFEMALSQTGLNVACHFFDDGKKALEWLENGNTTDYILLDLNMPKMGGMQVLQQLKNNDRLKHIPVVVCSTSSEQLFEENSKTLGAAAYVIKPPTLKELVKCLKEVLAQ